MLPVRSTVTSSVLLVVEVPVVIVVFAAPRFLPMN
jgi:hypothetical protein